MLDWSENRNGNFVCKNDDSIKITVFSDRNDKWRGIMDNRITENGYATAEDA
jgi:hypothetical protein